MSQSNRFFAVPGMVVVALVAASLAAGQVDKPAARSAAEVEILEDRVELVVKTFEKVEEFHKNGDGGRGSQENLEQAATVMHLARAELAAARADFASAVEYQELACKAADAQIKSLAIAWHAGNLTLDVLLASYEMHKQAHLGLVRFKQAAAAAKGK